MDAADFILKIQRTRKWVQAALLGAVIPAIAFCELLTDRWDFNAAPPWSWPTISIVPIASAILLFLPNSWLPLALALSRAILIVHATILVGMLAIGLWQPVAGWCLFVDLLLIAAISLPPPERSRPLQWTIFWTATLFGLGLPIALTHAVAVMWCAEAIAGDRPYCIQYASQTDAFACEPARTLFDLSVLKMQQRLGTAGFTGTQFTWQHPAVLVVGGEKPIFFRWSYSQDDFLDEMTYLGLFEFDEMSRMLAHLRPGVFCKPARHYGRSLAIWTAGPATLETTIADRRLSIPEAYRPRKDGGTLIIEAVAPDFAAFTPTYDLRKLRYWQRSYDVRIVDARSVNLSERLNEQTASTATEALPPQLNLERSQLMRGTFSMGQILTSSDDAGHITDLIYCSNGTKIPAEPYCTYAFTEGDLSFALSIDDPLQWRDIKQKLTRLLASFEASGEH